MCLPDLVDGLMQEGHEARVVVGQQHQVHLQQRSDGHEDGSAMGGERHSLTGGDTLCLGC